ncbi:MAG: hypothetical protein GXX96_29780 [Planctomycetaceae bacterium]|jgi:hypothetical protein|nr:hypothetical protein [Planctomycetaceae bacterium]
MKSHWLLFLCLSCLCAGGCRGLCERRVVALERENSQLNGLLWEMEFELESLTDENSDLKQRLAASEENDAQEPASSRPKRAIPKSDAPPPFDPGEFRPPVIEFPPEPTPGGAIPDSLLPDTGSRPDLPADRPLPGPGDSGSRRRSRTAVSTASLEEPALLDPRIEVVPPEEVALDSSRIKRIELASMIGTLHLDDKPGDDGLVIVVEPWDSSNQMLADAAEVSVVLIDPAEPAETARYAQWHFEAEEVAKLFRDGDLPGLHLELPWPGDPPRHDQLQLFVRYKTSDGRNLQTDSIVEVELGGRGRWIATDTPRVRPYEQVVEAPKLSPAIPQTRELAGDDREAGTSEAPPGTTKSPFRTVSAPRETLRSDPPAQEAKLQSRREPAPDVDRQEVRPVPKPAPKSEPPARQRPVWSPDRPW